MKIFYFSFFLSFISFTKSRIDENKIFNNDIYNEFNIMKTKNNITIYEVAHYLEVCFSKLKNDKTGSILCFVNITEAYLDKVNEFFLLKPMLYITKIFLIANLKDATFLHPLINNIFDAKKKYINKTFEVLRNNTFIFLNIRNILNINKTHIDYKVLFSNLSEILKINEVHVLFNDIYSLCKFDFIAILEYATNGTKISILINLLKDFIKKNQDSLVDFSYNLIIRCEERKELIDFTKKFITSPNHSSIIKDLKKISSNKALLKNISDIIELEGKINNEIFDAIITNSEVINTIIDGLNNTNFVEFITDVLLNLHDIAYLYKIIPEYISTLNQTQKKSASDIVTFFIKPLLKKYYFKDTFSKATENKIKKYIDDDLFKKYNISENCKLLFQYIYFNSSTRNFSKYYLKKFIMDSTKNKNDFLTFENCLNKKDFGAVSNKYNIRPIYIVGIIDDKYNKSKLKNSILFEKYNYLMNLCLPQGTIIYKDNKKVQMCNKEDYEKMIKFLEEITFNMNSSTIQSFILEKDNLSIKAEDYLFFTISLILIMMPLIINIFLVLNEKMLIKKYNKSKIINKLKEENKDDKGKNEEKEIKILDENEDKSASEFIAPKWHKLLIENFDIIKNIRELFNFSMFDTNIYNFNGITYIKGLLGISIILNIFGQTFFILFNDPTTMKVIYRFYKTISNPLYTILFLGLRYSPRLIFSCSGYILMYKFLNFIEKEETYYFLKFLILQSYKYILLIFVTFFFRLLNNYLYAIFRIFKSPILQLLKDLAEKNAGEYFINLFTFLFYNWSSLDYIDKKNTIQYFYIPINEVFLFLIGITIISIGYKFKLRIDYFIIFAALIFYFAKIFCYILIFDKDEIYSTLYFFSYRYGAFMINPLFIQFKEE